MNSRSQLWYNLLDAERLSRYYSGLADRWRKLHMGLSLATMLGSLAAAMMVLSSIEGNWVSWVSVSLFCLVSSLTAVLLVFDFSGRAQIARSVSEQVREIFVELNRIWYREQWSDSEAHIEELERKLDAITRVDLTLDNKLNERCGKETYEAMGGEHGGAKGRISA